MFEIWTDDDKTLNLYYGAVKNENVRFPSRVTKVLNADGELILEYVENVSVGTHPSLVLADCQAIFGE